MNSLKLFATFLWLLWGLSACTTTGIGGGQMTGAGAPEQPVAFAWKSTDGGMSGTMTASLPGAVFEGRFFQITRQTRSEVLQPLWNYWRHGWHDWPYWVGPMAAPYPTTQFITLLRQGCGHPGSAGQTAHALPLSPDGAGPWHVRRWRGRVPALGWPRGTGGLCCEVALRCQIFPA